MLSVTEEVVVVCRSAECSPCFLHEKLTPEKWIAYLVTTSSTRLYSSAPDLIALRRIGMLKNRSSTEICVPTTPAHRFGSAGPPCRI